MASSEAQRTLVKSPPELWAELSDPASLGRHLGELGEIAVVRTEPERAVEWEAPDVRGTARIEPSGWGTRVTLTIVREAPEPETAAAGRLEPEAEAKTEPEPTETESEPQAEVEPAPGPRRGFLARLLRRLRATAAPAPPEEEEEEEEEEPGSDIAAELARIEEEQTPDIAVELARVEEEIAERDTALLAAVLDRLGAAHHRPFSRA